MGPQRVDHLPAAFSNLFLWCSVPCLHPYRLFLLCPVRSGTDSLAAVLHSDPDRMHLYMVDESSLASTRQMQSFMEKIAPQDRVLLIGDIRQHQGVDAGKPFEQMQQAGMQTSQLDQIMRQKAPELLRVVEHFSKNETAVGVGILQQQGRVTEIPDNSQRIEAIAKDYAANQRTPLSSRPTTPAAVISTTPSERS
jgi:ATP-dependent exoDNAse (exonuclease V) alpha subunit